MDLNQSSMKLSISMSLIKVIKYHISFVLSSFYLVMIDRLWKYFKTHKNVMARKQGP